MSRGFPLIPDVCRGGDVPIAGNQSSFRDASEDERVQRIAAAILTFRAAVSRTDYDNFRNLRRSNRRRTIREYMEKCLMLGIFLVYSEMRIMRRG